VVLKAKHAPAGAPVREAGELLALEELDQTGLAITSEGALVRVLEVMPRNPLIMADAERGQLGHGFRDLLSKLRPGQTLQFYVETAPVDLASLLEEVREQVCHFAGDPPLGHMANHDPRALARWRLYAALEDSLRRHADHQAAVRSRMFVVAPYLPPLRSMRERLGQLRSRGSLPRGPLQRELGAHRRAVRESLANANAVGAELLALGLPNRLLNGEEVAELLWRRFNPTRADSGRTRPVQVSGELDAPVERERAQGAAVRLRAAIAQSSLDFKRSRSHAEIEGSAEQVIYVSNIAESTTLGWLLGAMMTRQPYALSVYVHALDRRMERMRLKASYKRVFALNRGAEAKGRVPDFDRYFQEQQAQSALEDMAGHSRANVFRVAIYQSLRAPGPSPDLTALGESVDYCADQIATTADCRVSRGEYQQEELWPATLPLGRDTAARGHKYMTRNVDGSVPLLGTSCGSPSGIPFAFADPGRTLELLDPYDRKHANQTMLIVGQSGKGKALDLETPIPTPSGWTKLGDLQVGDQVYDDRGHACGVTGVFDQSPRRPCFEVVFSDGSTIVADAEHRWLTHDCRTRQAASYRLTTGKRPRDMLGGSSRFRGVTRLRDGSWIAQVQADGIHHHLGCFEDEESAAAAASEGRLRLLKPRTPEPKVVTTDEIRRSLRDGKHTNHAIPVTRPLVAPEAELPLAPYTLGAWLGDGSSYHPTIFTDDAEIMEMIAADGYAVKRYAAPFAYGVSARLPRVSDTCRSCARCEREFAPRLAGQRFCSRLCARRSTVSQRKRWQPSCTRCGGLLGSQSRLTFCIPCIRATNPYSVLRSLGVLRNKHIPTSYLRASVPQRRALLAGLLDTDGCVSGVGGINFDSTNERLARDVRELALSLGYRATLSTKRATLNGSDCGRAYRVVFTTSDDVFRLERKRAVLAERSSRHNPERTRFRYIVDVRPVPSRPVRCITVDSPSHLFLAGEAMIPTHNTMAANVILGRCLAMGARVFGIDRAGHYGMLTRLVPGGREIDIGVDDSPWAINPWDVPDPANVGLQKITFLKSLHGLMMGADGLTVTERAQLDTAIRQVYAWAANRRLKPRESMLRAALLERAEAEREAENPELASMLRHLAERLSEFCDEGSYAYLLDRDTNVPVDAPVIVFDTRRCPTELLQLVMFMIVEYVREAALAHRDAARELTSRAGAPMFAGRSVLVIDEAWHMVSRRETGEYANDLARRARHIGLFLIVISQQMSDFDGEYGRALLRNSTLQLLLAQHPHELPRLKEALDLTDQEAAIIAQLRTVKGQYAQMLWINGERGRAKVSLPVGPLEYWMYTSDPLRDAPAREAAIDRHAGDVWAAIHDLATGANGGIQ
jgi:hypothetical protein